MLPSERTMPDVVLRCALVALVSFAACARTDVGSPSQHSSAATQPGPPPPAGQPVRDIAHFRMLTHDSTMSEVKRLVGEPDGDIGSGIHIYVWQLGDGTQVAVGTPDNKRLYFVVWTKSDGGTERLIGADGK